MTEKKYLTTLDRKRRLSSAKVHVLSGRVKRGKVPEPQFSGRNTHTSKRIGSGS